MSNVEPEEYGLHARDYLGRARACLGETSIRALFWAAFELRCGIEARLQQYLEARRESSAKIKQGWRIAKLARHVDRRFKTGDKVVRLVMQDTDGHPFYELVYTPVTSRLQKMGERLGNFLHAQTRYHSPTDRWWSEVRHFLESVAAELDRAVQGNLMGPPLWNPRIRRAFMVTELRAGESPDAHKATLGQIGRRFIAKVEYSDAP